MDEKESLPVFSFPEGFVKHAKEVFPEDEVIAALLEDDESKDPNQLTRDRYRLSEILVERFQILMISPRTAIEIIKIEGITELEECAKWYDTVLALYRELRVIIDAWEKTLWDYDAREKARQEEERNARLRTFDNKLYQHPPRKKKSSRS